MTPLTPSSDARAPIPDHAGARLDRIASAVATLAAEERRLHRLGFAGAERRCREQRRYWEFLAALFTLEDADGAPGATGRQPDWRGVFGIGEERS
jgi:hypothetical protein